LLILFIQVATWRSYSGKANCKLPDVPSRITNSAQRRIAATYLETLEKGMTDIHQGMMHDPLAESGGADEPLFRLMDGKIRIVARTYVAREQLFTPLTAGLP
jgi:hypothetical protein